MYERKDKWSVGHWMTSNPVTIAPGTSVRNAFFRMRSDGYRHLIVEEDGKLVGIVTDRDLRRPDISDEPDGWHEFYNLDDDYEVRHLMTTKVLTVTPSDPLERALQLFLEHKFGALPVVDKNGAVIGILTSYDLLSAFNAALAQVGEDLRQSA